MIKKLAKKSLALFGLYVNRTPRHLRGGRVTNLPVTVGKFSILMRSTSLLPEVFADNPNFATEMGRLAAATLQKYPNFSFIDVGANFGDTVAMVKSFANIPILCIEGDDQCSTLLEQNTRQFSDVSIHKLFLGEKTELLQAAVEKQGWNMTIIPSRNGGSTMLQLTSLDDFLASSKDSRNYKILKIDTEGFDCRIIRGGLHYLRVTKPVIVFEYNRDNMTRIGEIGIDTLSILREIGYERILFYDPLGRLVASTTLSNVALINDLHQYANGKDGSIYYYNLCLFHGDDEDLASRFEEAERARLST